MTICLIDDSNSSGGAQNLVILLKNRINMISDYSAEIHSSLETFELGNLGTKFDIIINCTDWCPEGYRYAESLSKLCENMYLLSQISFFKPFAGLYIDYSHHLWNRRESAKQYYDKVITLSTFQDGLWEAAGWETLCCTWLNEILNVSKIEEVVICAAHWNKNKNEPSIRKLASKNIIPILGTDTKITSHSLDNNPATPDEMFKPGVLYYHSSKTDVNPMTIYEASSRGCLVVVEDFPGSDSVIYNAKSGNIIPLKQFSESFIESYYGIDRLKALLSGKRLSTDIPEFTYQLTAKDLMKELTAVMNSYSPEFSDFGYECKPINRSTK